MNGVNILKDLATYSFFADLLRVMTSGEFTSPDQDSVEDEDIEDIEILGKMTVLERALYTMIDKYNETRKQICKDLDDEDEARKQICILRGKAETSRNHLWDSITERFAEKLDEMKAAGEEGVEIIILPDFNIGIRPHSAPDDTPTITVIKVVVSDEEGCDEAGAKRSWC